MSQKNQSNYYSNRFLSDKSVNGPSPLFPSIGTPKRTLSPPYDNLNKHLRLESDQSPFTRSASVRLTSYSRPTGYDPLTAWNNQSLFSFTASPSCSRTSSVSGKNVSNLRRASSVRSSFPFCRPTKDTGDSLASLRFTPHVMRDRNETDSVIRALKILESKKRPYDEGSVSDVASTYRDDLRSCDGSPDDPMAKRRRLTSSVLDDRSSASSITASSTKDIFSNLREEEVFKLTSIKDIVGPNRKPSLRRSVLNSGATNALHHSSNSNNNRLLGGEPLKDKQNCSTPSSPSAVVTSVAGDSVRVVHDANLSMRRRLSYMTPNQIEAQFAKRSAASELMRLDSIDKAANSKHLATSAACLNSSLSKSPMNTRTTNTQTDTGTDAGSVGGGTSARDGVGLPSGITRCKPLSVCQFIANLDQKRMSRAPVQQTSDDGFATPSPPVSDRASVRRQTNSVLESRFNRIRRLLVSFADDASESSNCTGGLGTLTSHAVSSSHVNIIPSATQSTALTISSIPSAVSTTPFSLPTAPAVTTASSASLPGSAGGFSLAMPSPASTSATSLAAPSGTSVPKLSFGAAAAPVLSATQQPFSFAPAESVLGSLAGNSASSSEFQFGKPPSNAGATSTTTTTTPIQFGGSTTSTTSTLKPATTLSFGSSAVSSIAISSASNALQPPCAQPSNYLFPNISSGVSVTTPASQPSTAMVFGNSTFGQKPVALFSVAVPSVVPAVSTAPSAQQVAFGVTPSSFPTAQTPSVFGKSPFTTTQPDNTKPTAACQPPPNQSGFSFGQAPASSTVVFGNSLGSAPNSTGTASSGSLFNAAQPANSSSIFQFNSQSTNATTQASAITLGSGGTFNFSTKPSTAAQPSLTTVTLASDSRPTGFSFGANMGTSETKSSFGVPSAPAPLSSNLFGGIVNGGQNTPAKPAFGGSSEFPLGKNPSEGTASIFGAPAPAKNMFSFSGNKQTSSTLPVSSASSTIFGANSSAASKPSGFTFNANSSFSTSSTVAFGAPAIPAAPPTAMSLNAGSSTAPSFGTSNIFGSVGGAPNAFSSSFNKTGGQQPTATASIFGQVAPAAAVTNAASLSSSTGGFGGFGGVGTSNPAGANATSNFTFPSSGTTTAASIFGASNNNPTNSIFGQPSSTLGIGKAENNNNSIGGAFMSGSSNKPKEIIGIGSIVGNTSTPFAFGGSAAPVTTNSGFTFVSGTTHAAVASPFGSAAQLPTGSSSAPGTGVGGFPFKMPQQTASVPVFGGQSAGAGGNLFGGSSNVFQTAVPAPGQQQEATAPKLAAFNFSGGAAPSVPTPAPSMSNVFSVQPSTAVRRTRQRKQTSAKK